MGRVLELGLVAFVVLAPWPLGGVPPAGRLAIEVAALCLLAVWCVAAVSRGAVLPPKLVVLAGTLGLAVAALQALPLGEAVVAVVSPRAAAVRLTCRPPADVQDAEARILGQDPRTLDSSMTLSVDPRATASALRTAAAVVALLLVATTVAAAGGARRVVLALLVGCALQGLYGLLVLLSGHDRIWHLPKLHNLDAATGTYVNKNHFACLLAMGLSAGLGLLLDRVRRAPGGTLRSRFVASLDARGSFTLFVGLLVALALAGLLTSFSRAGIAAGALGLGLAALGGRGTRTRTRVVILLVVSALAAVPLAQVGADRLVADYSQSPEELEAGRLTVWRDTLRLIAAFPVTGTGFGTFAAAYPLFRAPEVRRFYDHAHNDALQALAEGGVVGATPLALVLGAILAAAWGAIARRESALGAGLAAGVVAFAVHGLVDFNAHIPANLAIAACLSGLLLGLPWSSQD